MKFEGRSALVTGGAGGLGGAASRRLAELGAGVVIFDPNAERAEALARELGPRAIPFAGDLNKDEDVLAAIAKAKTLGLFSISINAAGTVFATPRTASAEGKPHDMESFRGTLEIHLMGTFNVCRLAAASFAANAPDEEGQRGVIINTASAAAYEGQIKQTAYAAAKGAIASMTLPMARDLGPIGVRVCTIAPGPIETPRFAGAPDELRQALIANIPFPKRVGRAEEFGQLAEAIIRNDFLNGEVIRLDGGMRSPLMEMSTDRS